MKIKISKRDIAFFFLGIFAFFLLDTIYNWDKSIAAFKEGYNSAIKNEKLKLD